MAIDVDPLDRNTLQFEISGIRYNLVWMVKQGTLATEQYAAKQHISDDAPHQKTQHSFYASPPTQHINDRAIVIDLK